MLTVLLVLLSILVWFVLQVLVWSKWQGGWRVVASIPFVVGVVGWAYYWLVRDSNLWPFWLVTVAPFAASFLLLIFGVHFIVMRSSR